MTTYAYYDGSMTDSNDPLIASWVYPSLRQPPGDIVQGPQKLDHHYNNGAPLTADFFSGSAEAIRQRKAAVAPEEWERVRALTPPAMRRAGGRYRSAFPLDTCLPPELHEEQRIGK